MTHGIAMVKALRTRNRFSATSVDQLPHQLVAHLMFGHQLLLPVPDIDRTSYFLVFGANPMASNGSLMTVPGLPATGCATLKARGGRMVVFDPRRTETAKVATEHHFVRPGTDAFVLLAMLHVLFAEGLGPRPGVRRRRWTPSATAVAAFTPERAEAHSGVPADDDPARSPGSSPPPRRGGGLRPGRGVDPRVRHGLPAGRSTASTCSPATSTGRAARCSPRRRSTSVGHGADRPRPLRPAGAAGCAACRSRPASCRSPRCARRSRRRATARSARCSPWPATRCSRRPTARRLDRALGGLDFMAAIDIYVNETTRHADVILPPTTALERDHYDLVFHTLAVRNTARFTPARAGQGARRAATTGRSSARSRCAATDRLPAKAPLHEAARPAGPGSRPARPR